MTRLALPVLAAVLAAAPAAAQTPQPVAIRFAATAGGAAAGCGAALSSIGTTQSTVTIVDFRFFVSKLRLVTADGRETPVALTQDGLWQVDDVALVDFEDATGACANGTPETRSVVEGTVPAGDYTGLRFEIGLPFDKNHADVTLAPSPLNLSRMFWNWNGGYKFMRLDIRSTGQPRGWLMHLGSTGCTPTGSMSTPAVSCAHRNVVTVDLPSFVAARDVVEMDVAALFATTNVDVNTDKTALGCMSGPTDPECAGLFGQLGLAIGETPGGAQKVFRTRSAATVAR
ncbi:MAG: MbnP family copper-binding protein [Vicinamibacterales bacterium]